MFPSPALVATRNSGRRRLLELPDEHPVLINEWRPRATQSMLGTQRLFLGRSFDDRRQLAGSEAF